MRATVAVETSGPKLGIWRNRRQRASSLLMRSISSVIALISISVCFHSWSPRLRWLLDRLWHGAKVGDLNANSGNECFLMSQWSAIGKLTSGLPLTRSFCHRPTHADLPGLLQKLIIPTDQRPSKPLQMKALSLEIRLQHVSAEAEISRVRMAYPPDSGIYTGTKFSTAVPSSNGANYDQRGSGIGTSTLV